ncbi:MAG: T9SS type A sorting domain-containing protein [Candidatus Marinimicrobia bacterium]|nr:T9SS type A sorting domain-containing protein [Candidatus Neomarinimicrobiota bacterium]
MGTRSPSHHPDGNWNGTAQITVSVADADTSVSSEFTLTVKPVNDAPTLSQSLPDRTIDEDDFGAIIILRLEDYFNDIDEGDRLTFYGVALDDGLDSLIVGSAGRGAVLSGLSGSTTPGIFSVKRSMLSTDIKGFGVKAGHRKLTSKHPSRRVWTFGKGGELVTSILANPRLPLDKRSILNIKRTEINVDDEIVVRGSKSGTKNVVSSNPGFNLFKTSSAGNDVETSDSTALVVYPTENFNGDIRITVTATDDSSASVSDTLILTVASVNDAPDAFALLVPDDSLLVEITPENLDQILTFSWVVSNDMDGDTVTYQFVGTDDLSFLSGEGIELNESQWSYADLAAAIDTIDVAEGTWTVLASDGILSTEATNGPFTLTIDATALTVDVSHILPETFALHQNYPNPFNPVTTIRYDLPEQSHVTIVIYDLLGRQVTSLVNRTEEPGFKAIVWNAKDNAGQPVSAGIYLYRIQADRFSQTRKMLLLK